MTRGEFVWIVAAYSLVGLIGLGILGLGIWEVILTHAY